MGDMEGGGWTSWLQPDIDLICNAWRAFAINTLLISVMCFGTIYWFFKENLELKTDRIATISGDNERLRQDVESLRQQLAERGSKPIYADPRLFQSNEVQTISRHTYTNETVELDGKIFDHCDFTNVTLNYRGIGPTSFIDSQFHG